MQKPCYKCKQNIPTQEHKNTIHGIPINKNKKIMAKKQKVEVIIEGICKDGKIVRDLSSEERFALHYEGQKVMVSYRPLGDMSNKEKLFAYLFGPLLDCLSNAMEDVGMANVSKNDWYEAMKDRFGRYPWYNPLTKKQETKTLDFSSDKTTSAQLNEFVGKIVLFLEIEVGVDVPDSAEFTMQKRLGKSKRSFS